MNKNRRKEIDTAINELDYIMTRLNAMIDGEKTDDDYGAQLRDIQSDVETIRDDEQDYMDNMPENLQMSDRYYAAEEAVDHLESAIDYIDDAIDKCDEFMYEDAAYDIEDAVDELNEASA